MKQEIGKKSVVKNTKSAETSYMQSSRLQTELYKHGVKFINDLEPIEVISDLSSVTPVSIFGIPEFSYKQQTIIIHKKKIKLNFIALPKSFPSKFAYVAMKMVMAQKDNEFSVILTHHFSSKSIEIAKNIGVGAIDFSGNAFLNFCDFFLYIVGKPKRNIFQDEETQPQEKMSVKETWILRSLIGVPGKKWTKTELAETSKTSYALGWNVVQTLLSINVLAYQGRKIVLSDMDKLMELWKSSKTPKIEVHNFFTSSQNHEILKLIDSYAKKNINVYAFTGISAAAIMFEEVIIDKVEVYFGKGFNPNDFIKQTGLICDETIKDDNKLLQIYVVDDPAIFWYTRNHNGINYVSTFQLYKDLINENSAVSDEVVKQLYKNKILLR